MRKFKPFAQKVSKQIEAMSSAELFFVDIPKDDLWQLYLASFPEGSNPIFRERTEHDCNCCKNFVRDAGGMIAVKGTEIMTVWDIDIGGPYQVVADAMAARVREAKIRTLFWSRSQKLGTVENNHLNEETGQVETYNHFHGMVGREFGRRSPATLSLAESTVGVFRRGLEEITDDAIDTVLELIDQNSLYRGEEHRGTVAAFRDLKREYKRIEDDRVRDIWLWTGYNKHGSRIRNTVIGTLLQDISAEVPLDQAVKSFEGKVAPANYKRPKPLITKAMVERAMKKIRDEGLEKSLYRRFATIEDVSVSDIIFADRSVKPHMRGGLEAELLKEVKTKPKDFSKVTEIGIDDFIKNVVPHAETIDVMFENGHQGNLMSLIAPKHAEAPMLFKWSNPFSWSYNGNVTDSIKQRVKAAGGDVEGYLRASLSWFNFDDLDLHVIEPSGNKIFFGNKRNPQTKGELDVDMNAGSGRTREAVENITWPHESMMGRGLYRVAVHNYCKRESIDVGFEVEIECAGDVFRYRYDKPVANNDLIAVAGLQFDGERITEIKPGPHVETGSTSKEVWGIKTAEWQKVSLLTLSPNHWGTEATGNRHYMFILDGCKNPEKARGFYNEFLPEKYAGEYRKVFEVLGDKTKCEISDSQLSGLGFSSTQPTEVLCQVRGNVNRVLKVKF